MPSPVSLLFGELKLREVCDHFKMNFPAVKQGFREYKENPLLPMTQGLLKLNQVANTLAVSTAECERGFSAMNSVLSTLRNKLRIEHVSSLMFIKLVGPPLELRKPSKFVKKWVLRRRSADHLACRQRKPPEEEHAFTPIWKVLN